MTKYLFSRQEVIKLLSQLRMIRIEYPPDLLSARRRAYIMLAAQLSATRSVVDSRRKQWVTAIVQEPVSTIIKALIIVFVAFLVAFLARAIATDNVHFGWLLNLLLH